MLPGLRVLWGFVGFTGYDPWMDTHGGCPVTEIGVCECRAWLGARASNYPSVTDEFAAQHEAHEARIGRKLDLVHSFHRVGALPIAGAGEKKLAIRADTIMVSNWKPVTSWGYANGADKTVNAWIDKAAATLKELAPVKVFLTVHHEPENDVGKFGTPDEYRAMWALVRERFEAAGVDNVVFVMAYMNYPRWNELVPELYPGDDVVDWVMFNGYGSKARPSYRDNVKGFLHVLEGVGDAMSKPLGVIEWGMSAKYGLPSLGYIRQATECLGEEWMAPLKAHMIFDSPGHERDGGLRVGYDAKGRMWKERQDVYNGFANHEVFSCRGDHG